ncbi:MAG: SDR family NAD(P)-dependent oxidoreductase [Methyloprofundus sp.]|nr:SDR family NAD(P)-dependent oxidoreductase [Methyloprofundus sp.]
MQTVLITGANRGLGLEFCRQYAEADWLVIAACREPENAASLTQLATQYSKLKIITLDVQNHQQIDAYAAELQDTAIDVFISNAGVYGDRHALGELDYAVWRDTLETNVLSAMKLAEAFAPHLAASKQGLFAAISSLMGSMADNGSGGSYLYRSSKAALNAVMKSLSYDFARQGTGVLIFHPGWVRTDMGGPNGLIEADESVAGMCHVIENFDLAQTGRFIKYDGSAMPW